MLVHDIKVVDEVEKLVPSVIRFKFLQFGNEIWRRKVYLSAFNGSVKAPLALPEGELDFPMLLGVTDGRDNRPDDMIEGRAEIVDGISAGKGDLVRNGAVIFGQDGTPSGYLACPKDVSEGLLLTKKLVRVVDMLRGPINLEIS
jgi:hypothetical protein